MPTFLGADADWQALRTEIQTDPAGLGYAGKSAPEIAALINTPADQLPTPRAWTKAAPLVPLAKVIQWAAQPDGSSPCPMAAITDASQQATDATRGVCLTALRVFGSVGSLDVADAINLQLIGQLEAAGKITANQKAALLQLGTAPASRAESLWGPGVAITAEQLGRVGA